MKILTNANISGWRLTGFLGKGAKWFFGFSKKPKELPDEPRLVSYAINGRTCTLNFGGVEYYYELKETSNDRTEGEQIG